MQSKENCHLERQMCTKTTALWGQMWVLFWWSWGAEGKKWKLRVSTKRGCGFNRTPSPQGAGSSPLPGFPLKKKCKYSPIQVLGSFSSQGGPRAGRAPGRRKENWGGAFTEVSNDSYKQLLEYDDGHAVKENLVCEKRRRCEREPAVRKTCKDLGFWNYRHRTKKKLLYWKRKV